MTYPPPGGTPDPYQPQQPYGQPGDPNTLPSYSYSDPYATPPGSPAGSYSAPPASGQPYGAQPYGTQPYGAQPYGAQPYGAGFQPAYGQNPATNTMAILSLVFAFLFAPAGIVFGHMAKKQIKQTGEQGDGLATAGLVLSYIFTGITLVLCCIWGIALAGFGIAGVESTGGSSGY